jgi:glycosyltransferase involved in cell wall biosynthesis
MRRLPRLVRVTTVPISLKLLLEGQPVFFRDQGFEVLTVSADGPEVPELGATGIPHRIIPFTRRITPWRDLVCLVQLVRLFRAIRPDIVHTHTPKAGLLGMLAAWITQVPVRLHTVAGLPLMETRGLTRRVLGFTEGLTYACATRVYPNSKGLLTFVQQHFSRFQKKFAVIGAGSSNGIDVVRFSATPALREAAKNLRTTLSLSPHAFVFVFIGRLVGDKGIHELVAAFQLLSSANAHLVLVGPFEDERDPVSSDTKAAIDHHTRIHAVGFQSDVRPWLLMADTFVFPSYREGFPNVVMQAACLQVPCIVSDINGCNELVQSGESGWLVRPKDVAALRVAMQDAYQRPDLREKFATTLRKRVTENYDRSVIWAALLAEYRRLLTFEAK